MGRSSFYRKLEKEWDTQLSTDKKQLPHKGASVPVQVLIALVVKVPFIIVGFTIVVINLLVDSVTKPKKKNKSSSSKYLDFPANVTAEELNKESRTYDIVLFGATGYTGSLAVEYVSKTYGDKISWAIAGRSESKLTKIHNRLVAKYPALDGKLGIIQADGGDVNSLVRMVKSTRAVCTTVGPFSKYGVGLVEACARYGTGYTDITGETDFFRHNITKYDKMAQETGATIISFCGNDCVPWDLMTLVAAKKLDEQDAVISEVNHFDERNGGFSGGTVATILMALNGEGVSAEKSEFDPLLQLEDGSKAQTKTISEVRIKPGYDSQRKKYVGNFALASVNGNCVKRTNAILHLSDKMVYRESLVYSGLGSSIISNVDTLMTGVIFASSWIRPIALSLGVIPNPGEGPSKKELDDGFLRVVTYASGTRASDNKVVKFIGSLYYPTDAGYRDTARMLVEAGLTIALDKQNVCKRGVLTPASGLGMPYLHRLTDTGCVMKVHKCA